MYMQKSKRDFDIGGKTFSSHLREFHLSDFSDRELWVVSLNNMASKSRCKSSSTNLHISKRKHAPLKNINPFKSYERKCGPETSYRKSARQNHTEMPEIANFVNTLFTITFEQLNRFRSFTLCGISLANIFLITYNTLSDVLVKCKMYQWNRLTSKPTLRMSSEQTCQSIHAGAFSVSMVNLQCDMRRSAGSKRSSPV
ncbi:hypothetical protein MS3_00000800 [Schistosoma haematobium]|uniref:Uncharacterized protein n=1 Tax=Schistosoma haematobium TaxID=6185 RepID=A0A922IIB3_SCHHA|nr:hypothetical protein MS3_00000800 [Schistosoma haematobium]KAH9579682.1 hypothetical protein MS3_00000800 [Schistosoma haematobium]